jgi:probable rRNA maturation factor
MLAELGRSTFELSVLLCNDEVIAALNEQYRGRATPTDVLSFPLEGEPAEPMDIPLPLTMSSMLGDVVISIPRAAEQAPQGAGGLRQEVTRLLAHGLLHLIGWDHETEEKLLKMELETERLVALAEAG